MPVLSQTPVITYTANGSVTSFAYTFQILASDDLKVYVGGTVVTTGYSVTGVGNAGGGNVIFLAAPANGLAVRLARFTTVNRITDYVEGGAVPAATLDADFDRTIMMLQEYSALALREDTSGVIDAAGRRVANIGLATGVNDAVTKNYVDTVLAGQVTSATNSASAASSSATTAGNWATAAGISAASASTYAGNASTSATNAAASAVTAAGFVPSQTGNNGKYLQTNGTSTTWAAVTTPSGALTASGYTQSTARLIGRTTAATGAPEEISVGSGLTLSAGSITNGGVLTFNGSAGAITAAQVSAAATAGYGYTPANPASYSSIANFGVNAVGGLVFGYSQDMTPLTHGSSYSGSSYTIGATASVPLAVSGTWKCSVIMSAFFNGTTYVGTNLYAFIRTA